MADKTTSDEVASIAGRVLAQGNPFEHYRDELRKAISAVDASAPADQPEDACCEIIADRIINAVEGVMAPVFADLLSLAGSALSQDEPE